MWIDHPENSVVFTVKGDIRLVRTKTFRTPYSLRFPRHRRALGKTLDGVHDGG